MDERTEDAALSRILTLTVGGTTVRLRTLSLDESDAWLSEYGTALQEMDAPEELVWLGDIPSLLLQSPTVIRTLVASYDIDNALPEDWQQRMTKRELKSALEGMVEAEDPFGADAARSVAAGFGAPSAALMYGIQEVLRASQQAISTAGRSRSARTTRASAASGAGNNSSSDGRTGTTTAVRTKRHG